MVKVPVFLTSVCCVALVGTGCAARVPAESTPTFVPDPILADSPADSGLRIPADDVLSLAKTAEEASYQQALDAGAEIIPVDDGRSFVVWWQPEGFDPATDTTVVSLGGHAGWATRDFVVWKDILNERGYGFLSVQWWFGRSLEPAGYYKPNMIYGLIRDALREKGVAPGNAIFQAYSMGSANSYAVTAFDRWEGDGFFAVTIANSGVYESDFPPNAKIPTYDDLPFDGTNWIFYCAVNDEEHPDWNKCEAMDETRSWVESLGGTTGLYLKDEDGGHGSFMIDTPNVSQALDVAESMVGR